MSAPALLGIAHGSPEPRAESVLEALMARVRAERPGLVAVLAHLGHSRPDVATALDELVARGFSDVVVVPLLLTAAYHVNTDIPALLAQATRRHPHLHARQAVALGPHPQLFALLRRRLVEIGADSGAAIVLGAVGTSDPVANAELADVAATIGASVGFASGQPDIGAVVESARKSGASQVVIASYVLAPGRLPDRFAMTAADLVARPLGAEPEVVDVVLERYDTAAAASLIG
jgi:sirohydrochlorin ferrochelatase